MSRAHDETRDSVNGADGGYLPLSLEDMSYSVGDVTLVRNISAQIEGGARTIILGPNGAGKSLFLRLCHGLLQPSSGRLRWRGGVPPRPLQTMVFQRPVLLRRSALDNIFYALARAGMPRQFRRQCAEAALERAGLSALAQRPARILSSGEQQRLALARAWAVAPRILFLDEPTANLDPAATGAIETLIDHIHQGGTKIIMTTHDLGQARRLADDVLFFHNGRLLEHRPATEFFTTPISREADAFLQGKLIW